MNEKILLINDLKKIVWLYVDITEYNDIDHDFTDKNNHMFQYWIKHNEKEIARRYNRHSFINKPSLIIENMDSDLPGEKESIYMYHRHENLHNVHGPARIKHKINRHESINCEYYINGKKYFDLYERDYSLFYAIIFSFLLISFIICPWYVHDQVELTFENYLYYLRRSYILFTWFLLGYHDIMRYIWKSSRFREKLYITTSLILLVLFCSEGYELHFILNYWMLFAYNMYRLYVLFFRFPYPSSICHLICINNENI